MAELTLIPKQRATIGFRSHNAFRQPTQRHIPGTVVRGAFAAAWIAQHDGRTDRARAEFVDLFEGGVRFGPLFLGSPPASLAIRTHKYGSTTCAQQAWDAATDSLMPPRCPDCDGPLAVPTGEIGAKDIVIRRTHVEITAGNVAKDGSLYAREELDHRTIVNTFGGFRGALVASAKQLECLGELPNLRVGGRLTSHGLMTASMDLTAKPAQPQRIGTDRIVLRLRSPGIFVDDRGRPGLDPNPAELRDLLGSTARIERRWTRWTEVGGWHVASGLPKPTELAVQAGSTYVVATDDAIVDDALARMAVRGLGLRRHEGFGDVAGPSLSEGTS